MGQRTMLFLGGLGAPPQIYRPWFKTFRERGWEVHLVPNTAFCLDAASTFAQSFIETAKPFDEVDVVGISYGGNAALYGAWLSPELREKIRKMALVCAPLGGVELLGNPLVRSVATRLSRRVDEMLLDSELTRRINDPSFLEGLPFELHCLYHPRDKTAPPQSAQLGEFSVNHRLEAPLTGVPSLLVHDAVFVHPETFQTLLAALTGDQR